MTAMTENIPIETTSEFFEDNEYCEAYRIGESLELKPTLPNKCDICNGDFTDPVVLHCLHVFDRKCLSDCEKPPGDIFAVTTCPKCGAVSGSLATLQSFHVEVIQEVSEEGINGGMEPDQVITCSLCTEGAEALYTCANCGGTMCQGCRDIHRVMKMFSSHAVTELTEEDKRRQVAQNKIKPVHCKYHPKETYKSYCFQCHVPACIECLSLEHHAHVTSSLEEAPEKLSGSIRGLVETCQSKQTDLKGDMETLNNLLMDVATAKEENKSHVEEVCNDWKAAVDEIKEEFLKKNKELHDDLEMRIFENIRQTEKTMDHIDYSVEFIDSYLDKCQPAHMVSLVKQVLDCLMNLSRVKVNTSIATGIPFRDDHDSIRETVRANFGWFGSNGNRTSVGKRSESDHVGASLDRSPTGDFPTEIDMDGMVNGFGFFKLDTGFTQSVQQGNMFAPIPPVTSRHGSSSADSQHSSLGAIPKNGMNGLSNMGAMGGDNMDNRMTAPDMSRPPPMDFGMPSTSVMSIVGSSYITSHNTFPTMPYDAMGSPTGNSRTDTPLDSLSFLPDPSFGAVGGVPMGGPPVSVVQQPLAHPGTPTGYNPNPNPPFPSRSTRCQTMSLLRRWGSQGSSNGDLNSPHGFCLGFDEEIVVADTQNHRIQIFGKDGTCVDCFGVAGREDGHLWYPRKVAITREHQKYIVCDRGNERSRMQIFTRSGHFIKKISIKYIDIVAGLAVDPNGRIVAVDSVSPSIFVISEAGDLITWFDCSDHMREPSDIAISREGDFYICDFKGHCVAVFSESGKFLRRIGAESITNFPNGIDISDHGDVLIGDSHGNRFHVAVFNSGGNLQSEFECTSLKVSRCCGLKISSEGYVVTLAKNNHSVLIMDTLYIG